MDSLGRRNPKATYSTLFASTNPAGILEVDRGVLSCGYSDVRSCDRDNDVMSHVTELSSIAFSDVIYPPSRCDVARSVLHFSGY